MQSTCPLHLVVVEAGDAAEHVACVARPRFKRAAGQGERRGRRCSCWRLEGAGSQQCIAMCLHVHECMPGGAICHFRGS
eukprot:6737049-Prymnesium_polylepis.2